MSAPTATANDPQSGMDEILRTRQLLSASRLIARFNKPLLNLRLPGK